MWQWLNSEMEVLIREGFIYVPLLLDAQIEAEVGNLTGAGAATGPGAVESFDDLLVRIDTHYFIKSLSLDSFVENYPAAFPEAYEQRSLRLRQRISPGALTYQQPLDARLRTILFEILPHFWRRRRHRRREKNGRAEVLAYLAANLPENRRAHLYIKDLRERESILRQMILRLESLGRRKPDPLPERRGPVRDITGWFEVALEWKLVWQELNRWQRELDQVQDLLDLPEAELRMLLTVAAQGAVELDCFGCFPDPKHSGDYWIYVRTGDYLLQDYFGRLYLFPDCRVAVSTAGPFKPIVLETYKHPLLRRIKDKQQICLTDYQPEVEFSAAAASRALEEGLNALFYGYNSRKRNGYNSLDGYGRDKSEVDFEDLRLDPGDVRVLQGELEVKNRNI
jgi:hypothetical protein